MPNEGSTSPKERVNIVYRPATGDVQEDVELPLKLMVLGDFTLRKDDTMLEDRKPISVDKDNFDKVMQSQGLSLQLQVPNKLSDDPDATLSADLKFETLKDFGPDALVQMVPELAKAAVAAGADGLMIEVHNNPARAGEADAAARGAQGA